MRLRQLDEPLLTFHKGEHICPKEGIATHGVFDTSRKSRRQVINIGGVGSSACLDQLEDWLALCRFPISSAKQSRQPTLFRSFCGFNLSSGFATEFRFSTDLRRTIAGSELSRVMKVPSFRARVEQALELYLDQIRFLAQNRQVDAIVCVIPDDLFPLISSDQEREVDALDSEVNTSGEMNFRRALKARAMHLGAPLQLVRAASLQPGQRDQQDDATKAWNFCTALYYKAGPTVPWKLSTDPNRPSTCALGVAFYRSRDYSTLQTSLAQIFDELGNGLILRGTPVDIEKGGGERTPHLDEDAAAALFARALVEYRNAMGAAPSRVVVHKSSGFNDAETAGFQAAAQEQRIGTVDFVTILDSPLRLFRNGSYPPYRGTLVELGGEKLLLQSRGSVWYYATYPGMYVPQPIEIRVHKSEESPTFLAKEILGLTKMNWNNTQFDGKYPVTLGCARKVGQVLKYLKEADLPQIRYAYYM